MASFTRILGGLVLAGGVAALLAGGTLLWAGMKVYDLRSTQAYTVSCAFLKKNAALRQQLGADATLNPLVWGEVDSRIDGTGSATLTHVITSSKGLRFVTVQLQKADNEWVASGASGQDGDAAFAVQPEPQYALVAHDPAKAIEALTRGDESYAQNDFAAALKAYDDAVALDPSNPSAWLARGRAYGRQGEPERALSDLDQAAELAPDNVDVLEALSWARLHSGRDREALASLDRLLALRPDNARAMGMRADANSKLGNAAAALADAAAACAAGDAYACNLQQHLR